MVKWRASEEESKQIELFLKNLGILMEATINGKRSGEYFGYLQKNIDALRDTIPEYKQDPWNGILLEYYMAQGRRYRDAD